LNKTPAQSILFETVQTDPFAGRVTQMVRYIGDEMKAIIVLY